MSNYSIALSGLQNTSSAIDSVSNNIANANTVGYKAGEYLFADQFVRAVNPADSARVGMGTQTLGVRRALTQGTITNSSNPLDLAISGSGMFRLLKGSGTAGSVDPSAVYYTRNGQFAVDKEGYIVNENGLYLTGFQPTVDGNGITDDLIKNHGLLRMPNSNLPGNETTTSRLSALLDSRLGAFLADNGVAFDPTQATYNNKTTQTVFDSDGIAHTLEVYYRRVDNRELTIELSNQGFAYPPSDASSPNTSGDISQNRVTLNKNSALIVDTAPDASASAAVAANDATSLSLNAVPSNGATPVDVTGKRIFVNGLDTGVLAGALDNTVNPPVLSIAGGQTLTVPKGASIGFYDVLDKLDMTLVTPDGVRIGVSGSTNKAPTVDGDVVELEASAARVEVYAALDGKFYGFDAPATSNRTIDVAVDPGLGYKPAAELMFIGGRNIDSLVSDSTGTPLFKTVTQLSTRIERQAGGTIDLVIDLDLTDSTMQAGAFQVTHSSQNGEPLARLTNVTVDNQGRIVGIYGTGKQQYIGQLALVHFDNFEGLMPVGKNAFAATNASGTEHSANGVVVGRAGTGIFGDIKAQALESSNVDLANELVRLMVLQRSYTANSQSMRAFDQTLRDTLQIIS